MLRVADKAQLGDDLNFFLIYNVKTTMEKIIVTLWITFGLYMMVLLAIMAEF